MQTFLSLFLGLTLIRDTLSWSHNHREQILEAVLFDLSMLAVAAVFVVMFSEKANDLFMGTNGAVELDHARLA